jgi:hypothetical protein
VLFTQRPTTRPAEPAEPTTVPATDSTERAASAASAEPSINRTETALMIAQIRCSHADAEAFRRRTAPRVTWASRFRIYLIAAAVAIALILLVGWASGTVDYLTGHDTTTRSPITTTIPVPAPGEYIPTPAGPPTD